MPQLSAELERLRPMRSSRRPLSDKLDDWLNTFSSSAIKTSLDGRKPIDAPCVLIRPVPVVWISMLRANSPYLQLDLPVWRLDRLPTFEVLLLLLEDLVQGFAEFLKFVERYGETAARSYLVHIHDNYRAGSIDGLNRLLCHKSVESGAVALEYSTISPIRGLVDVQQIGKRSHAIVPELATSLRTPL